MAKLDPYALYADPVDAPRSAAASSEAPPAPHGSVTVENDPYAAVAEPVGPQDATGANGYGDQNAIMPSKQLSPEDEATHQQLLRHGSAHQILSFLESRGMSSDPVEMDKFIAAREKAAQTGAPIDFATRYQDIKPVETDAAGSLGRGVADTISFGTLPKVGAAIAGAESALKGNGFSDAYHRQLDENNATVGGDEQDHPWMRLSGQLLGGLAIPTGLEGVGLKAGSEVLRAGGTMAEARAAVRIAVTRRSAAMGAGYGAAHGAGSSDTIQDAAVNAAEQGVAGAGGGVVGAAIAPAITKGVNATARAINRAGVHVKDFLSVFTHAGAQDRAANLLQNAASDPVSDVIDRIERAPASMSGAKPTLAEVAGDAGIAGFQRGHANTDLATQNALSQRNAENALARTGTAASALDEGVSPQAIQDLAQSHLATGEAQTAAQQAAAKAASDARLSSEAEAVTASRGQAAESLSGATARISPIADRDATGAEARSAFDQAYAAKKQQVSEAYRDPRLTEDFPVQLRPLDPYDVTLHDESSQAPDISGFKEQAVQGAKSAIPKRPQSLLQFVRARGGISLNDANAGDIRHVGMDARSAPGLLNGKGRPLDELREAAEEHGFIPEHTSLADFIDELDRENRGLSRLVRPEDIDAEHLHEAATTNRDFWRRNFDEAGLNPLKMSDDEWRRFYDHMKPTEPASRTLGDISREPANGKLMGPFQQTLAGLRDRFYGDGGTEAPSYIKSFFGDVLGADVVGIRKLEGWERRAYDLAAQAPDRANASFMQSVARAIGGLAASEGGPARQEALLAARALRREQGRLFETGDVAKTFARDRYGNPLVGDTTIPTKIARPGASGGDTADRLIGAVGHEKAETFVRQELRRAIDEGGVDTAAKANAIATRYGEMAKRFPGLQRDLDALKTHADALDRAEAGVSAAGRAKPTDDEIAAMKQRSALHEAVLASPLAKLADSGTDPGSFVAQLLRRTDDGRQLGALHSMIRRNPDAVSGLRRALGDFIVSGGAGNNFTAAGEQIPSISKTQKAIAVVMKRAGDILTPQQKIVLKGVARELQSANFAATASKPAGSETALNKTFTEVLDMIPGVKVSMLNKVVRLIGNGEEVKHLLTQAVLDPDFAATLLKRPTAAHWIQVRERMVGPRVLGIGSTSQSARLLGAVNDNVARAAAQEGPDKSRRIKAADENRQ